MTINKNKNYVVLLEAMLFNKRDIQNLQLRLLKAYRYIQAFRKTRTKRGLRNCYRPLMLEM
jgi:hypothetical protein